MKERFIADKDGKECGDRPIMMIGGRPQDRNPKVYSTRRGCLPLTQSQYRPTGESSPKVILKKKKKEKASGRMRETETVGGRNDTFHFGNLAADTRAVHTRDGSSIDRVGCLGRQDRDLSGLSMYMIVQEKGIMMQA